MVIGDLACPRVAPPQHRAILVTAITCLVVASWLQWTTSPSLPVWAARQIAIYLLVPVLVIHLVLRQPFSAFGLRIRGIGGHSLPYLVALLVTMPFVVAASFSATFQDYYPYFSPPAGDSLWPLMFGWWALYALQFVAIELFFRGFLVLGLAPRFGTGAVALAVVPYILVHLSKPVPEVIGAAFAGVTLGILVLRSRSIWLGVAVHVIVALSLDALALANTG